MMGYLQIVDVASGCRWLVWCYKLVATDQEEPIHQRIGSTQVSLNNQFNGESTALHKKEIRSLLIKLIIGKLGTALENVPRDKSISFIKTFININFILKIKKKHFIIYSNIDFGFALLW